MTATITTAELADRLGTDARTLRKFLRAEDRGVGKGARYALPATKQSINALAKRFAKWGEAQAAAKAAKAMTADATDDADDATDD